MLNINMDLPLIKKKVIIHYKFEKISGHVTWIQANIFCFIYV